MSFDNNIQSEILCDDVIRMSSFLSLISVQEHDHFLYVRRLFVLEVPL
jgi:hypothetical protein